MSTPLVFEDPADIKWKWRAEILQQFYFDSLSDRTWELYEKDEYICVARKVAFAIFGDPQDEKQLTTMDDEQMTLVNEKIGLLGYDKKQCDVANKITTQIVSLKPPLMHLHIAFLFIAGKEGEKEFSEPIFRVLQTTTMHGVDTASYVDAHGRIYEDWARFLAKNRLPECIFCYPECGYYDCNVDESVRICFAKSPACRKSQLARRYGDTASSAVSLVCAGVGVASLFTPVAPFVLLGAFATGAATGVYGGARGGEVLYDRIAHSQSISLADSEARGVWLKLVATTVGTAAGVANAAMMTTSKAGEILSQSTRTVINFLNISNVSVNGVVIADRFVHMAERYKEGKLTTLEILQFNTSVFFYTNNSMSIETARTMIKDSVQSHQEINEFNGISRPPTESPMYRNGRMIKRISNVDDYYHKTALPSAQKIIHSETTKTKFQLFMKPMPVPAMIIELKILANKDIICEELEVMRLLNYPNVQTCSTQFLHKAVTLFGTEKWPDIKVGGRKIFKNLYPFEEANLGVAMETLETVKLALSIADRKKCRNSTEFVEILKNEKIEPLMYESCRLHDNAGEVFPVEECHKIFQELFGDKSAMLTEISSTEVFATFVDDETDTTYGIVINQILHEDLLHYKTILHILD